MGTSRPTGVSLIAILYILLGVGQVLGGIGVVSMPMISVTGTLLEPLANGLAAIGLAILAVGALLLAAGYGLWMLRGWGRLLTMVLASISAVGYLIPAAYLFGGFEIGGLGRISAPGPAIGLLFYAAFYGAIVYYLFRPEIQNVFDDGGGGAMQMACPSCQRPVDPSYVRCPHCGYALVQTPSPTPPPKRTVQESRPDRTQQMGQARSSVGQLVAKSGPRRNTVYQLQARTTVGRDAGKCQIVLEDDTVSGRHAELLLESGQYSIVDLASTNHVYVNGKRVNRMMLLDGDVVKLGNTTLVYRKT